MLRKEINPVVAIIVIVVVVAAAVGIFVYTQNPRVKPGSSQDAAWHQAKAKEAMQSMMRGGVPMSPGMTGGMSGGPMSGGPMGSGGYRGPASGGPMMTGGGVSTGGR